MSISPRPALTLAAVVAIISALVIVTYNATYVDTSNILTDKQSAAAVDIYGGSAEDYSVVPAQTTTDDDGNVTVGWEEKLEDFEDIDRIIKIIEKSDGSLAFDIKSKGYKDGFDILVGVKDGAVAGVSIISVGEETPGLGTKTNDPDFLSKFEGMSGEVTITKSAPSADNEVQAVSSATYSSKGVAKAVNIALAAYEIYTGGEQN